MNLLQLLNPAYLFDAYPGSEFNLRFVVYGFFILTFISSFFVSRALAKRPLAKIETEFFGGLPYRLREMAILGLIFTFFRDQNVPYLGMRAWLLIWPFLLLAYSVYIWKNYKKNFTSRLTSKQNKKMEDKYKPKKKRK